MKLYVRIKRPDGKWTFRAACPNYHHDHGHVVECICPLSTEVQPCGCLPPHVYCQDHQPGGE